MWFWLRNCLTTYIELRCQQSAAQVLSVRFRTPPPLNLGVAEHCRRCPYQSFAVRTIKALSLPLGTAAHVSSKN